MSDQLVDVYSKLNENEQPHYGQCQLVVGDGTVKVQFRNGRAKVPVDVARLLSANPHLEIPALGSAIPPGFASSATPPAFGPGATPEGVIVVGGELDALQARVRELEAMLKAAEDARSATPPDVEFTDGDTPPGWTDATAAVQKQLDGDEVPEHIRLAQEFLAEEGEPVPVVEKAIEYNEPFQPLTGDGQPRCRARKGDGGQCANAAVNGDSCGLAKHKEQLAA